LKATVVISEPVTEPKPRRKKKVVPVPVPVPDPPKVTMSFPDDFTAHLDHKLVDSSVLSIKDPTPHLIRLRPKNADRPEITLRLSPPADPGGNWHAAVHSTPWMQITLNKRPAGQTPKSKLPLPKGPFTLLLKRDDVAVPLSLEIKE
jgi:hypothetical protein